MTGVSTLGQALRQIENIKSQQLSFSNLSTQLATGKKTQSYAGLNTDALTSVRSRTDFTSLEVFINNINRADTTLKLSLSAIEEFQAQTENFADTLISLTQQGDHQKGDLVTFDDPATPEVEEIIVGNTSAEIDVPLQSVINQAKSLSGFVTELLNTRDGDRFLFAGADSSEQPIRDTGTLQASLNTLITEWKNGTITTQELLADLFDGTALNGNPNAITDSTIGYSASLSNGTAGRVFVRADENSEFDYTALANEQSLRNVVVALSVFQNENLPPIVNVYEDGNFPGTPDVLGAPGSTAAEQQDSFYELYNGIMKNILESIDDVDDIRFRLETVRVQANETKETQTNQKQLLLNTISSIEDVDQNEVAVRLTTLQTQLEASFNVTSITQRLSLINFL